MEELYGELIMCIDNVYYKSVQKAYWQQLSVVYYF